jgi:glycosyltransferase 2 family protein
MAGRTPLSSELEAARVDRDEVLGRLTRTQLLRRAGFAAGVVVAVVLAIVELPGLHAVRSRFAHADAGWIVVAVAMEAASVACFALALQRTFKARLGARDAITVGTTAQGVNAVVPAGGAAGFAFAAVILTDAGLPVAWTVGRLIALFLITSVLTNLVLVVLGGAGTAVGVLAYRGSLAASVVPAGIAFVLLVAYAHALGSPGASGRRHRSHRQFRFLGAPISVSGELVRGRDLGLALGALGYVVCDLVALAAALAALGWDGLGLGTLLLGYTLGQIGSVIPLPGTTEGGLVGALVLYGAPLSLALGAVLVYRTVAIAVPLVLAAVGATQLRHGLEVDGAAEAAWAASVRASQRLIS